MAKVQKATKTAIQIERKPGFRVYRFPDSLRAQIVAKREATNTTNRAVLEASVTESLPKILQGLQALGLSARIGQPVRPMRLQISDKALGALKVAAAQSSIPSTKLLAACLSLTCGDTPVVPKARKGRKAGAK